MAKLNLDLLRRANLAGTRASQTTGIGFTPFEFSDTQRAELAARGGTPPPASTSTPAATTVAGTTQPTKPSTFAVLMKDLLTKVQGLGEKDIEALKSRKRNLREEALSRLEAMTPETQRNLSPAQQAQIRAGQVGAITAEEKIATSRIQEYQGFFKELQKFDKELAEKIPPDEKTLGAYRTLYEKGEGLSTILSGVTGKQRELIIKDFAKNADTAKRNAALARIAEVKRKPKEIEPVEEIAILSTEKARRVGLPISLVGRTEEDIAEELNSPNPPSWFVDVVGTGLTPEVLQNWWDRFRGGVLEELNITTNKLDFDNL